MMNPASIDQPLNREVLLYLMVRSAVHHLSDGTQPTELPAFTPEEVMELGSLRTHPDLGGVLSALGINCLRSFPGRGALVWGAKTVPGANMEWKYLNVRRLALHVRDSVTRGTAWAGTEVNAEPLWAELRTSVSEFMRGLWMKGALLGQKPEEAFFVRCGRDTMTQNDLDQARVVILIGFAATRPAEFVTVRVAQTVRKP
jgi:phage tail sheath protein FI